MDIAIAREIVAATEGTENPAQLFESYSGRGMFGKTTAAVEINNLAEWTVAVAQTVASSDDPYAVAMAMAKIRYDDLGRGMIFY